MVKSKKTVLLGIAILMLLTFFLFAGCTDQQEQTQNNVDTETDSTSNKTSSLLATVNDEEITLEEVSRMQQTYAQQGQQLSEENALEQVIDEEVLFQKAQYEGYDLNDTEAETTLETTLQQQNQTLETYKQYLQQQNVSYEQQLKTYKEQLSIQSYLDAALKGQDFTVTDQEAEAYYQSYEQQSSEEIPPYEDLKSQIIDYLKQQKQNEAINTLVQDLREEADIQYNK